MIVAIAERFFPTITAIVAIIWKPGLRDICVIGIHLSIMVSSLGLSTSAVRKITPLPSVAVF